MRLEQCAIIAPFNGRVVSLGLFEHEIPVPQKPFLTILEADKLEIELIVPSMLVQLKPGSAFEFTIDETKGTYPATLKRLGAAVEATPGQRVASGDVIVRLESAELDNEIRLAERQIAVTRMRLARRTVDEQDRIGSLVLERELSSLAAKRAGLRKQRDELTVRAQRAGTIVELNADLHPGRSITLKKPIALIGDSAAHVVQGYLAEQDLWRVKQGLAGRFVPDDPLRAAFDVTVADIAVSGSAELDLPELSSTHGGPIAATADQRRREIPGSAQYRVRFDVGALDRPLDKIVRGKVVLDGTRESLLARGWRQVLKVLVRESGA